MHARWPRRRLPLVAHGRTGAALTILAAAATALLTFVVPSQQRQGRCAAGPYAISDSLWRECWAQRQSPAWAASGDAAPWPTVRAEAEPVKLSVTLVPRAKVGQRDTLRAVAPWSTAPTFYWLTFINGAGESCPSNKVGR